MVNDSSVCFDGEAVKERGGLGLISMEERAKLLREHFQPNRNQGAVRRYARVPLIVDIKLMRTAG
jgi:hypothetical protein